MLFAKFQKSVNGLIFMGFKTFCPLKAGEYVLIYLKLSNSFIYRSHLYEMG